MDELAATSPKVAAAVVEQKETVREVAIVRLRIPDADVGLVRQVAAAVEVLRTLSLYKPPGVAETIDWAEALGRLGVTVLDEVALQGTLGNVLKYREDLERVRRDEIADVVERAVASR